MTHKKTPQVVLSSLIKRYEDFNENIEIINEKIQIQGHSNIDKTCLNRRSKLLLNRRGLSFLTNNFRKFVNSL